MVEGIALHLILVHALIIALSIPLILKMIRRNRFYGFRVPKTLASDEVWYPANVMAGKALCLCSLVGLGVILAAEKGMLELSEPMKAATTVASIFIALIYSLVRLRTL